MKNLGNHVLIDCCELFLKRAFGGTVHLGADDGRLKARYILRRSRCTI